MRTPGDAVYVQSYVLTQRVTANLEQGSRFFADCQGEQHWREVASVVGSSCKAGSSCGVYWSSGVLRCDGGGVLQHLVSFNFSFSLLPTYWVMWCGFVMPSCSTWMLTAA